ncbi:hypothetical protein K7X08_024827 [Anisodus acutangulus]|uniref:Metallo-beta-lactamase domain-containing protein n=1 Tax=Anisodus acutangulus TaxID=402998 RepID=A0A9Q1M8M1_9SOLA|nr:hypothetical protein K7X08_024827 [Anisodus acutangulus]
MAVRTTARKSTTLTDHHYESYGFNHLLLKQKVASKSNVLLFCFICGSTVLFCETTIQSYSAVKREKAHGISCNTFIEIPEGADINLAFLPFKPMLMKVLPCSFISGIKLNKAIPLLKILQPKHVLVPESLSPHIRCWNPKFSVRYFSENETVAMPKLKNYADMDIATDLYSKLRKETKLIQKKDIARLKGELLIEHGKCRLVLGNKQVLSSQDRALLFLGRVELNSLLMALQKMGMKATAQHTQSTDGSENMSIVCISEPNEALIVVTSTRTMISVVDETTASLVSEAVRSTSALAVFSPLPIAISSLLDEETSSQSSEFLDSKSLIQAEPWYKTVTSLQLWSIYSIDLVLISSPMGMLGLPFLTRSKDFRAKIYATEGASTLGKLMMEDLISMHIELRQFYGPEESGCPQWMTWEKLELLPKALKDIVLGSEGTELGGWMSIYSAADIKGCMEKVQSLKYLEEACYNGSLTIKACSSGLEIGACNWNILCPKGRIVYLSGSVFASTTASSFNYKALQGSDVLLYSDFTACNDVDGVKNDFPPATGSSYSRLNKAIPLLKILQPKHVLVPESLSPHIRCWNPKFSVRYFSENETVAMPKLKNYADMDIATDLYSKLRKETKLIQKKDIARLKGELLIEHGKCRLVLGNKQVLSSQDRALLFLGRVELNSLLMALQKMGMKATAQHTQSTDGSENMSIVCISEPNEALIVVTSTRTMISVVDETTHPWFLRLLSSTSALAVFSPLPIAISSLLDEETSSQSSEFLDSKSLIQAEPWYKTVTSLQLWSIYSIDLVLISSPMDICNGRSFHTRKLMMEDLISMHIELRQFYGPEESGCPQWMTWEKLELLPKALKDIVLGSEGTELGGWMSIYSAADIKGCMEKVQSLKYLEEACYNGSLTIKACSSGLEIGACNWNILCPKGRIVYLSGSVFASTTASSFNYKALQGSDVLLYSDFTACNDVDGVKNDFPPATGSSYSRVELNSLLMALQKMGMKATAQHTQSTDGSENMSIVCISEPNEALIVVTSTRTMISVVDETTASLVSEAVRSTSALAVFSPLPIAISSLLDEETSSQSSEFLDSKSLIQAEPWYKTVTSLQLWSIYSIDLVLISSPMGMLGLPFLTCSKDFRAKIYATEGASTLGKLMMEDLISMHIELRQFYGPEESGCPQWMTWEKLELLPKALKDIVLGSEGTELGGWMSIYSAADIKGCMEKVQSLKYLEEACYNGSLTIKACSSGLEIAVKREKAHGISCNTFIEIPEGADINLAFLPFKPMLMKVLPCSFISGIKLNKAIPLLKILQPKHVLVPESLSPHIRCWNPKFSVRYFSENETVAMPKLKNYADMDIATDLYSKLRKETKLIQKKDIARLKGELLIEHGKCRLVLGNKQVLSSQDRALLFLGRVELNSLLMALQKMGMKATAQHTQSTDGSENMSIVCISEPNEALIVVTSTRTMISVVDETTASLVSEAVRSTSGFI